MQSSIVTHENAEILLLQHEEVVRQGNYLKMMYHQAGAMHDSIRLQQIFIGIILLSLIVIVILLSFYIRAFIQKKTLYENLQVEKETNWKNSETGSSNFPSPVTAKRMKQNRSGKM